MTVNDDLLRIPEVARRLGIDGPAVYGLIDRGQLAAGKGEDGFVYVTASSTADLRAAPRHDRARTAGPRYRPGQVRSEPVLRPRPDVVRLRARPPRRR